MLARPELTLDTRVTTPAELAAAPHAQALALADIAPLLASPDSGAPLRLEATHLTDGTHHYPLRGDVALLLPARLHAHFTDRLTVPPAYGYDAFLQYFLLSSVKQYGETNAASDNVHYQRHLFRMREACKTASGLVLDVGCDDPRIGASLLPPEARYVGLDPFCTREEPFRLIGVGEHLPFADATLDGVMYNTSLDHLLDWRRGLQEAARVLKPSGTLFLATLVWTERADLVHDAVHFHHFREYEIFGGLAEMGFVVQQHWHYDYKGDTQRHGLYLTALKA